MAVKIRPMTSEDFTGQNIRTKMSSDNYDLINQNYIPNLTEFDDASIMRSLAKGNKRSYITLAAPTFNYVIGQSKCAVLWKLLGFDKKTYEDIVDMRLVYDTANDQFITIEDANTTDTYLYGAEIAEKFIRDFDIEQACIKEITKYLGNEFKAGSGWQDLLKVVKGSKNALDIRITADYYLTGQVDLIPSLLKNRHSPDTFRKNALREMFKTNTNRLSYLLNMPQDKSAMWGMLNYHISVVPTEMMPEIDGREHKLMKRYTQILRANAEYDTIRGINSRPKDIAAKYRALDLATCRLQYKNFGMPGVDAKPDDLAILERIKSKKGHIRNNCFGKRQDYSGRAVVSINPYLPLDYLQVPELMLPKLYEYHVLPTLTKNIIENNIRHKKLEESTSSHKDNLDRSPNVYDRISLNNLQSNEAQAEILRIIKETKLYERVPLYMGRQPTLHKQSLQGFFIRPTRNHALGVNPLVCPAFNMDFDGDQAHVEVPLSEEAIREVLNCLLTTRNIYLAKTGVCTTEPRMEMLYGMFMCTRKYYEVGKDVCTRNFDTANDVKQAIIDHRVKPWQTVKINNLGYSCLAGDAAMIACFREGDLVPRNIPPKEGQMQVTEVTSKTIGTYMNFLLRKNPDGSTVYSLGSGYAPENTIVGCINRMVELGFKVARIYSPSMSVIQTADSQNHIAEYDTALETFYEDMEAPTFYFELGLETPDNYKIKFDTALSSLQGKIENNIFDKLGEKNGYVLLSKSGARGSKSNLTQAFAVKGRVKKNSTESFDALISHSYVTQLTTLEHMVCAYGGRQGQMDKSLKTGDTGYSMRKMWHATQGVNITCNDCGTQEGMVLSKEFIASMLDSTVDDDSAKEHIKAEVKEIFAHALEGRILINGSRPLTAEDAMKLAEDDSVDQVTIRSVLYCKKPCCAKCFGIDWNTHQMIKPGVLIGIISAQSIGEPQTQLVMKQFQKGGVAVKSEMTSAFDKADNYTHVKNIAAKSREGKYPGYDPLAWATGDVVESPNKDMNLKTVKIKGATGKSVAVPKDAILKKHAVKGEGLSYKHGDYDIHEYIEYNGIQKAQLYLMFKLYLIFKSEVNLKLNYFEMLVYSMTRYLILDTDRSDLRIGQYCNGLELNAGSLEHTEYDATLLSVKVLPLTSNEALDTILMENHMKGLSHACLLNLTDSMTKPLNRVLLGKTFL